MITAILIIVARALRLMINDMESLALATLLIFLRGVIHLSLALVWTVSVYQRITNKQARAFVLSVGVLIAGRDPYISIYHFYLLSVHKKGRTLSLNALCPTLLFVEFFVLLFLLRVHSQIFCLCCPLKF